jgi:hypothetical protein
MDPATTTGHPARPPVAQRRVLSAAITSCPLAVSSVPGGGRGGCSLTATSLRSVLASRASQVFDLMALVDQHHLDRAQHVPLWLVIGACPSCLFTSPTSRACI